MAFRHGKSAAFQVDATIGAASRTDISAYLTDISMPRSIETAETTTFGVTGSSKTYVTGLNDATISISGNWDSTLDGYMTTVLGNDTPVLWVYGPEGTASSRRKYSGSAILTKYDVKAPVGGVVTFSADYQITGPVAAGSF